MAAEESRSGGVRSVCEQKSREPRRVAALQSVGTGVRVEDRSGSDGVVVLVSRGYVGELGRAGGVCRDLEQRRGALFAGDRAELGAIRVARVPPGFSLWRTSQHAVPCCLGLT